MSIFLVRSPNQHGGSIRAAIVTAEDAPTAIAAVEARFPNLCPLTTAQAEPDGANVLSVNPSGWTAIPIEQAIADGMVEVWNGCTLLIGEHGYDGIR